MIALADPPIVDVAFPVRPGAAAVSTIPADHGYTLFAAISSAITFLHGNDQIGIHPVSGMLAGGRRLQITRDSVITVRLSADLISNVLPLAGLELDLAGAKVTVGAPRVLPLVPVASVGSRLVVIKGMLDAQSLRRCCSHATGRPRHWRDGDDSDSPRHCQLRTGGRREP